MASDAVLFLTSVNVIRELELEDVEDLASSSLEGIPKYGRASDRICDTTGAQICPP